MSNSLPAPTAPHAPPRRSRRRVVASATLMLATFAAFATCAACFSTSQPRVRMASSEVRALRAFPTDAWDGLLHQVVDGEGHVDYAAVRANRNTLDRYLAAVADAGPTARPDLFPDSNARLAFAINAYNATVFRNVIDREPIRKIDDELANFFYFTEFVIDGTDRSLKTYEDDVVREGFKDPRAHFALNCASASCPQLPAEAFRAERLDEQLDREARKFCNQERNVKVVGTRLILSQIFEWFEDDFTSFETRNGNADGSVIDFINRWRAPDAQLPETLTIEHVPYDWTINAQHAPGVTPTSK